LATVFEIDLSQWDPTLSIDPSPHDAGKNREAAADQIELNTQEPDTRN
jgi:hypothetical protein